MGDSFNPRSRTGSDLPRYYRPGHRRSFNPRSRTGSDAHPAALHAKHWCFNPRSRTGSDRYGPTDDTTCRVSIHAPARGATTGSGNLFLDFLVSIHAPARGATLDGNGFPHAHTGFNPRSRTGSDKGRGRMGGIERLFQSTLPHGERPPNPPNNSFNLTVSIHAPARGATAGRCFYPPPEAVSIHAPARGATCRWPPSRRPRNRFNPRSRTGSDLPFCRPLA